MPRMPDDMAARYGGLLDEFDASIKALNKSKSDTLEDLRSELKSLGLVGAEVSAEIAMLKGAVKVLSMTQAEQQKANDKDEGISEYITILSLARARAHARGGEVEHDADGVIIEPQAQPAQTGGVAAHAGFATNAGAVAVEAPATVQQDDPATSSGAAAPEVRDMLVSATRLPGAGPETNSPADTEGQRSTPGTDVGVGGEAVPVSAAPSLAGAGDRGQPVPPPSELAPVVTPDRSKPNPVCQDPEDCGVEASWNFPCGACLRRKAERQAVEAVQ